MQHSSRNGAGYSVTNALEDSDFDALYEFLKDSYWSKGIPRATMERSIRGSLPFVVRDAAGSLAGFARVITDRATFGYIGDLFVLPRHRGRGLSKRLMQAILAHPDLQGFRRWMLATRDAHALYEKFGFRPLARPEVLMERHDPNAYAPRE
ncbi:MAG TPA: GNAT family N-acetyltransferase [Dongiaceae bacterium]|jgi:GNAT superfamily N-acetyltransferase|nr:GNAT family N-acetyltransferase [Dongiaceae bacterium]